MKDNRFDILPIVSDQTTREFFKTVTPNQYDNISKMTITHEDVLPLDTAIREVIKSFVKDNRTFYFLTYHSRITGLITLGNLNCRQVQVYIFGIICELERTLSEFINEIVGKQNLEDFMIKMAKTNNKMKETLEHYKELVQIDLENKLTEHLFFIDLFNIIEHFGVYTILKYSKTQWSKMSSINELRNLVAHPTRSLLDNTNHVEQLWRRIGKIEELTFRLNQNKPRKC